MPTHGVEVNLQGPSGPARFTSTQISRWAWGFAPSPRDIRMPGQPAKLAAQACSSKVLAQLRWASTLLCGWHEVGSPSGFPLIQPHVQRARAFGPCPLNCTRPLASQFENSLWLFQLACQAALRSGQPFGLKDGKLSCRSSASHIPWAFGPRYVR